MKKLIFAILLFSTCINAQVGIGTTTPNAALNVSSNNDGILVPRIALTSLTDAVTILTLQDSEMIYNTATAGVAPNNVTPGYYYWSTVGATWVRLLSSQNNDWSLVGNSGTIAGTNFIGTSDAQDVVFKTNNSEAFRVFNSSNNVAVGTTTDVTGYKFIVSNNTIDAAKSGIKIDVTNTGGVSTRYGINSDVFVPAAFSGQVYGYKNYVKNSTVVSAGGFAFGSRTEIQFNSTSTGTAYGNYVSMFPSNQTKYAAYHNVATDGTDPTIKNYATFNRLSNTSNNQSSFAVFNEMNSGGTATKYGVYNTNMSESLLTNSSGNGVFYGVYNDFRNTGTGSKYGIFNSIPTTANGTNYGIYSDVIDTTNDFSGYFLGRLSIGTTTANNYIMPLSRGTAGQIMVTDGAGNVSWTNASASNAWSTSGNTGTNVASNFIGTSDNNSIAFRSNSVERMRILNTGEIVLGNTTAIAGDILSVYGNDDLINAYSTGANSRGVYSENSGSGSIAFSGLVTSGTALGVYSRNMNVSGTGLLAAGQGVTGTFLVNGSGSSSFGNSVGSYSKAIDPALGWGVLGAGNNETATFVAGAGGGGAFTGSQWGVYGNSRAVAGNRASYIGHYRDAGGVQQTVYLGAVIGGTEYKVLSTGGASVSTTMPTRDGERILYAPEAPENWFFDIGEVELINGKAMVKLDPLFIDCISDSKPFKVFVQGAENTIGSIRITRNQNEKTFILEDMGGASNGVVQYSIYAIWKNKSNLRFPKLDGNEVSNQQVKESTIKLEMKKNIVNY